MKICFTCPVVVVSLVLAGCQSLPFSSAFSKTSDLREFKLPTFAGKPDSTDSASGPQPIARSITQVSGILSGSHGSADRSRRGSASKSVTENLNQGNTMAARAFTELKQGNQTSAFTYFDQAKRLYERVLAEDLNHAAAHHGLAKIADEQKDFPAALDHYNFALASSPNDPSLISDLGWSYILQGKFEVAESTLNQALQWDPSHRRALDRMGYLYGQHYGDYDRAFAMFRRGSTDADAQSKIAQLFPNGRPQFGGQVAQQPGGNSPIGVPPSNSMTAGSVQNAPNNMNQQLKLKQRMEQARMRGVAARNQQPLQSGPRTNPGGAWPATAGYPNGLVPQQYSQAPSASLSNQPYPGNRAQQFPAGPIPDNQINGRFAEIDAGNQYNGYRGVVPAGMTPGSGVRQGSPQPGYRAGGSYDSRTASAEMNGNGFPRLPDRAQAASPGAISSPNQNSWPLQRGVGPAGLEKSNPGIQRWPFAPAGGRVQGLQNAPAAGQDDRQPATSTPSSALTYGQPNLDSHREAAYLGMNAGPGQMFPMVAEQAGSRPASVRREHPGTGSRINGSQYPSPASYNQNLPTPSTQPGLNSAPPQFRSNQAVRFNSATGFSSDTGLTPLGRVYSANAPSYGASNTAGSTAGTGTALPQSRFAQQPSVQLQNNSSQHSTITPTRTSAHPSQFGFPNSTLPNPGAIEAYEAEINRQTADLSNARRPMQTGPPMLPAGNRTVPAAPPQYNSQPYASGQYQAPQYPPQQYGPPQYNPQSYSRP